MDIVTSVILANISNYIGLIPSIFAFFRIKSPYKTHRQLALLVWVGFAIAMLAQVVPYLFGITNLWLLHIYTIVDFILLTFIYSSTIGPFTTRILIIVFPLFAAINSIFFEHLITLNVLNRSLSAFILMFYALSFFAKTLREMKIFNLERSPLFWISIGVLFYNAGSFFIFLFSQNISATSKLWATYFGIHSIFTILLYIFYTIALWVQPKT